MTRDQPGPPHNDSINIQVLVSGSEELEQRIQGLRGEGVEVRTIRGIESRSIDGLFDEWSRCLDFPAYFSRNRDSFDECLAELAWVSSELILFVLDPDRVLEEEDDDALKWLVSSLKSASDAWKSPIRANEWWDRGPIAFRVVLAANIERFERTEIRWTVAGGSLIRWQ